jgi:predicted enzyme related to lactoylglutathione lyase
VVWHELNTTDVPASLATYPALFGWQLTGRRDLGPLGVFHLFGWESDVPVGSIADIAGRPGVHPQWLFHFAVPALDPACAAIRAAGGLVIGPLVLPGGDRVAVCDDPQGAAFALRER